MANDSDWMAYAGLAVLIMPARIRDGGNGLLAEALAQRQMGLPLSAAKISAIYFCARTLLPESSRGGDSPAMPNRVDSSISRLYLW
jgi:hypothetical protein